MNYIITIIQVLVSILLIIVILLQSKGGGLGSSFGGSAAFSRTRRGAEKVLFRATILLTIAFIITSILNLFF